MGPVVVVVIFPLLEAFGEEIGVVDDLAFEQPVELLRIDPVGTLHRAVQPRSAGAVLIEFSGGEDLLEGHVTDSLPPSPLISSRYRRCIVHSGGAL